MSWRTGGIKLWIVSLSLVLTGCSINADNDQNNHGYGYAYDAIGVTGLRLRHASGEPFPTIDAVESLYVQVARCMGLNPAAYAAPLVVMTSDPILSQDGYVIYGVHYLDTGLILISADLRDVSTSYWTYEHEFVHYFLNQSGFPVEDNRRHYSPLFYSCTQPPGVLTP